MPLAYERIWYGAGEKRIESGIFAEFDDRCLAEGSMPQVPSCF